MEEPTEPEALIPTEDVNTEPQATPLLLRKMSTELRMTVVEQVYYQQPGVDPIQIDAGYSYFVQENEQPFQRIAFAGPEWKSLEVGWIVKPSCVVIQNKFQVETRRKLTEEEASEAAKHIIRVKYEDSKYWFELTVNESMRFKPSDVKRLQIQSAYGLTRYIASLIPE